MPELPDVEIAKRYVDSTSLHKTIKEVETHDRKLYKTAMKRIREAMTGKQLNETGRIGKHLFIRFGASQWLALHFGMTGELHYFKNGKAPDHTKLNLHFKNNYNLSFTCPRTFGEIQLIESIEDFDEKHDLGPDALEITKKLFKKRLENKKGMIKPVLMDQSTIAGIGNIYSDEILYQSKVHPKAKVKDLSDKQLDTLFKKMKEVLKTSINRKAQPDDLPKSYLIPKRKEGADCPDGKGQVKKIKVSGRGCYYCPEVQSLR